MIRWTDEIEEKESIVSVTPFYSIDGSLEQHLREMYRHFYGA